jgi:hypothetical protein
MLSDPGPGIYTASQEETGFQPSRMEAGTRDQENHHGLSEAVAPSSNAGWFQLVGSSSLQDGRSLLGVSA